ncbi:DUF5103 domain-containing protein [Robertkochia solimangrovi]|uniref:type IX secretion system plug protein n=1 Tax=Robertkochia solimangrovi TaxID=2213046 RepID=UPI0011805943|nr:DUF5103 domain-containing protein [Robertkochia solimangrovi]TRZ41395.1 DUF5103 domain-containing protein [Robertkochia solimangrovi]
MKLNRWFTAFFSLTVFFTQAQIQEEIAPPENIKSVIFTGSSNYAQFPIVKIGEQITLTFDDLYADEANYYYRIEHCNYDWTPSKIMKTQYLNGLDNQRIITYRNSLATLQPYTHYTLEIPNRSTRLKITGNHILKIFDSQDNLVFSRRFIVYSDAVAAGIALKRTRDFNYINTHQRLEITINSGDFQLINPQNEVKLCLLQNSNFKTAIYNIAPQFISGEQLLYKYDMATAFPGGNEYYFFDTKEVRVAQNSIAKVELKNRYNHYLYTNEIRQYKDYTYFSDINGDYSIQTFDTFESDGSNEADYTFVRFSLAYEPTLDLNEVYVYGKFNNYELQEENKLTYNPDTGTLNTAILLKQGVYNYKFVTRDRNGIVNTGRISGDHWETENEYLVVVYYRKFGDLYDSVIGLGSASSLNISN